ncbi:HK97 family phage prohead protease [Rhizobium grahamii]|uniref:HK97 family phage prohead protease n=1 Tax=Rhizobium grahamii TaxID=1120045 RepID=A0A5Q0C928_9HYPH|nr:MULTISPECIES: HK97 family phage prohead protease [Rhizobium]QFY60361.1 HK97 family phage prohead protease [Rhizobium grahamii]QRM50513.1 HK97 family phage prohead protease [Rhizobium sp. BG6]
MSENKGDVFEIDVKAVTEDGTFSGYASVFNVKDSGRDIVMPGAFSNSLKSVQASKVKMLWQHDRTEPIGVWTKFEEDAHGLKATGKLILETTKGREVHSLMKAGAVDGLSIGYRTVRDEMDRVKSARLLHEVDLREVSVVTFPMNSSSTISSVKTDESAQSIVDILTTATSKIKETK